MIYAIALTPCESGQNVRRVEDRPLVVSTEAQLQRAFEDLTPNGKIVLNFESVKLTKALVVNTSGVEIRGRAASTELHCPPNDNALIIQYNQPLITLLAFLTGHLLPYTTSNFEIVQGSLLW